MSRTSPRGALDWSLRTRVTQATAAVMVLVVSLMAVVAVALWSVKVKGDDVIDRWDPAYQASQDALAAMVNQETGLRGFALGRQEIFLQPYQEYQQPEVDAERKLRGYLAGRADLIRLLDAFEARVDDWHTTIATPFIARVRAGDPDVGQDSVGLAAKNDFDRLRAASATLNRGIGRLRDEARSSRRNAFTVVWIAIGIGGLIVVGSGLLLGRGLRRSVLDPISGLVDQARAVASGELGRPITQSGPREIVDLGADVDAMRGRLASELARVERARARLAQHGAELARSNDDLEQFAYVASHDLSEPLRKVTNFCQLLERQYADQLDDRARQYIAFMVDGAKRMQALITDLLSFSRVGRSTDHFVPVDLDLALQRALGNVEAQVQAAGATILAGPLPTVPGDATLLTALLQNLVSNAVKYRSPDRAPHVEIGARRVGGDWELTVSDNGIGIDPQYAERIFAIFQRLHLRDQYGGTGIGLALCRKIVDFHKGRIWLGDSDGPGSRFVLTLPERQQPVDSFDDEPVAELPGTVRAL